MTTSRQTTKKILRAGAGRSAKRATGKAKTAYELCERVCQHIAEEPKRYDQTTWGAVVGKTDLNKMRDVMRDVLPVCGTTACRAGWIVALHDGMASFKRRLRGNENSTQRRANAILGFESDDDGLSLKTQHLFDPCSVDPNLRDISVEQYARAGIRGLRAFMRRHKAHLEARSLKMQNSSGRRCLKV